MRERASDDLQWFFVAIMSVGEEEEENLLG
jgi:hypothetical protein